MQTTGQAPVWELLVREAAPFAESPWDAAPILGAQELPGWRYWPAS